MAALDDDLVVGGLFQSAGGNPANGIARWDGSAWHRFPDERAGNADTLANIDGTLFAGGYFLIPGSTWESTGILRWAPPAWVAVGQNFPRDNVMAIASFQGQLYAGGAFTNCCGGAPSPGERIARFDGSAWHPAPG